MSSAMDIDEILGRTFSEAPVPEVPIEVEPNTLPVLVTKRVSYEEHLKSTVVVARCPTCNEDMGTDERVILTVEDPLKGVQAWDACSLGCATIFFRKRYRGSTRGIQSSIKLVTARQLRERIPTPDMFDFNVVYDR